MQNDQALRLFNAATDWVCLIWEFPDYYRIVQALQYVDIDFAPPDALPESRKFSSLIYTALDGKFYEIHQFKATADCIDRIEGVRRLHKGAQNAA